MARSHLTQTGHTFSLFLNDGYTREFVAENFEGLLQVHLQSASGLPSRDVEFMN